MIKSVQGSFHQADLRFGNSAGTQCACCGLVSVTFTLVKSPGKWISTDLDFIVVKGDEIYNTVDKVGHLLFDELPRKISLFNIDIDVNFLNFNAGVLCGNSLPGFLFNNVPPNANGFLLILKHMCISVVWTKKHYFIFDSHSKDESGQTCPDGYSTLLKFSTRKSLELHVINSYLNKEDVDIFFEAQFVEVVGDAEQLKAKFKCSNDKNNRRKKNKPDKSKKFTPKANCDSELLNFEDIEEDREEKTNNEDEDRVESFKLEIMKGPFYICVVCNRGLYRKTVKLFRYEKYNVDHLNQNLFTNVESCDKHKYICITCDRNLLKGLLPCQAVCNKLGIDDLPDEIKYLNRLEKVLIAKRILFKKVTVMPKGQQPKIKGSVCNIPVQANAVSDCLPQSNENIILVKLKRKIEFRGHVYFENVRPEAVHAALWFLKQFNPFYSSILINVDNISRDLLSISDPEAAVNLDEFPILLETEDDNIETENPLDADRTSSNEMCLIPNIFSEQENLLNIAPGQNKSPTSFFNDDFCEEQAFPYLLPRGKYGYKVLREVKLTPVKYFNQRLLNYNQRFSSCGDYIFFAHYVMQQINLFNQMNIATNKVKGTITAGQLQKNFKQTVRSFICESSAYTFMKCVKGTPAYWKQFLYDVLAMVKQLGLPTFFFTLSCADLQWSDLLLIIAKLNRIDIDDISNLNYQERCEILNRNPVFTARHFQFRIETFFKEILLHKKSSFPKISNYVIKVEFQFRGSPHIHAFLWLENPPILTSETKSEYVNFIDNVVRADLPDNLTETKLNKLVERYQIHSHSKSCRKYKNIPCRFNYGRFFTDYTICAEPLNNDIPETEKQDILSKRSKILGVVKDYIDNNLNPHTSNYNPNQTIQQILLSLGLNEEKYYAALSTSPDQDFEIHLRRPPNSCYVNNYFTIGLEAWEANLDIQPVFNYFKAISYMCSYFSKCETESSLAMKKAAEESNDLSYEDQMKKLAIAFLSNRQCSLQEAVYQLMPELWLRKTFPSVMFANTNLPNKRFRVCKSEEELSELPENSTDIFKKNNLDRYLDRPNTTFKNGRYRVLNNMCYAEFLAYYVLETKSNNEENDFQPTILCDDDLTSDCVYPRIIPLMTSKDKMRCRKVKKVLRYFNPNPVSDLETHAHHLLMLFYPFRKESELLSLEQSTYSAKLNEPAVLQVVNINKKKYEPWGDEVEQALLNLVSQPRNNAFSNEESYDDNSITDDDNDDENVSQVVDFEISSSTTHSSLSQNSNLAIPTNDEINSLISSLNKKQRAIFELVNSWARNKVKHGLFSQAQDYLQLFITGGAGTGKSHLIKTIYASVTKTLNYCSTKLENPKVLLLAPTGVAAINISGTTIHSALAIPVDCKGLQVSKLSDKKRSALRVELQDLSLIIIDEISMVSNKLLLFIHQRLLDIFGHGSFMKPFAGISVIVVGDLYQLPPVFQKPVYADYYDELYNIHHLWKLFKMCELEDVMRQRGDHVLINLLNNVRIGNPSAHDISILESKVISLTDQNYPINALHIYAENEPARQHNVMMLERLNSEVFLLEALDQVPKSVPNHVYDKILNSNISQTKGLSFKVPVKVGARVMLTVNIDISDRLINGQIGTVSFIECEDSCAKIVYIKFDDIKAGVKKMASDPKARRYDGIPIEKVTLDILTKFKKDSSPVVKRTQFPLTLSWACTVHKVQGLDLAQLVVSFDLLKQKAFNHGQIYVALSRAKTLEGLFLIGNFSAHTITADERSKNEYERLRQNCLIEEPVELNNFFSISYCNVRSLKKHVSDISTDQKFVNSQVILCTETQIAIDDTEKPVLEGFFGIFNNSRHKYSSLAAYYNSCDLEEIITIEGFSLYNLISNLLNFKILLLYRRNEMELNNFFEILNYFVTAYDISIIIGDFNLNPDKTSNETLQSYQQLVDQPTHIGGSTLDQCFIKKVFLENHDVSVVVKSVFFSDHECVKLYFR